MILVSRKQESVTSSLAVRLSKIESTTDTGATAEDKEGSAAKKATKEIKVSQPYRPRVAKSRDESVALVLRWAEERDESGELVARKRYLFC